jgi:lipoate-protein ligase A
VPTSDPIAVPTMTPEAYTRSDEAYLRAGGFVARVAVLSSSALSVGVSQPEEAPCIRKAHRVGIPVVRRSTGGLGLWHGPGDIAWSLVLPRSDPWVGRDFSKAYARLGVDVVRFLGALGVVAEWRPPVGRAGEYCLISGRGAVLTVGDRAIGGAAQHLTRQALLHHGVLPYRLDRAHLSELFELAPEVVDRTLTCLDTVVPGHPPEVLARRLQSALRGPIPPGA